MSLVYHTYQPKTLQCLIFLEGTENDLLTLKFQNFVIENLFLMDSHTYIFLHARVVNTPLASVFDPKQAHTQPLGRNIR